MNLLEAGPGALMLVLMLVVVVVVMTVSEAKSQHPARSPTDPYVHVTVLKSTFRRTYRPVSYTHLRAHET